MFLGYRPGLSGVASTTHESPESWVRGCVVLLGNPSYHRQVSQPAHTCTTLFATRTGSFVNATQVLAVTAVTAA